MSDTSPVTVSNDSTASIIKPISVYKRSSKNEIRALIDLTTNIIERKPPTLAAQKSRPVS